MNSTTNRVFGWITAIVFTLALFSFAGLLVYEHHWIVGAGFGLVGLCGIRVRG